MGVSTYLCFAFIKVKNPAFNMKLLIALAFLLFIVSMATPTCAEQIPNLKKDNIVPLQKKWKDQTDCASCFNEIFAATADCAFSTIWLQCIQGIIGEENPCYDCICDVVPDACLALGCGFSC